MVQGVVWPLEADFHSLQQRWSLGLSDGASQTGENEAPGLLHHDMGVRGLSAPRDDAEVKLAERYCLKSTVLLL